MLGAVVTTSSMSVGSRCLWAEPGVGAVLTQHRTDPRLGPKILARLKKGEAPDAIVADLGKNEPNIGWRQLAVMAASGKAAFFHGAKILSTKNGKVGRDCVAIGNIIRSTKVVDDMIAAFEGSEDQPLAERLMRGIEAGQAAGGEWKQVGGASRRPQGKLSVRRPEGRPRPAAARAAALSVGTVRADGRELRGSRRRSRRRAGRRLIL